MLPSRDKGEFYKKDRKVLRFFCKYKDSRLQGDKRDYILYYYLLNDTVEIKEVTKDREIRGFRRYPSLLSSAAHEGRLQGFSGACDTRALLRG